MSVIVFKDSPYLALEAAYPGRFKPWELSYVPMNYWTKETAGEAVRWLFEDKLKWSYDERINNVSVDLFKKHGLGSVLNRLFKNSPYSFMKNAYPNMDCEPLKRERK